MSKPVVYLAGPVANTAMGEAFAWRADAAAALAARGIEARSPMRNKKALAKKDILGDYHAYAGFGWQFTPHGILVRDYNDCVTADGMLVNLLGTRAMSFGTGMELAWAFDRRIPIVVVIESHGNIHDRHPMFAALVKLRTTELHDAIDMIADILGR